MGQISKLRLLGMCGGLVAVQQIRDIATRVDDCGERTCSEVADHNKVATAWSNLVCEADGGWIGRK